MRERASIEKWERTHLKKPHPQLYCSCLSSLLKASLSFFFLSRSHELMHSTFIFPTFSFSPPLSLSPFFSFFHRNSVYTLEDRGVFYPCPSVLEIEPVWKQKKRRNSVFPSLSLMRFLSLRFFKPLQIRSEKIEFGNQFLLYGCTRARTHTHARTHARIPIARYMRVSSREVSLSAKHWKTFPLRIWERITMLLLHFCIFCIFCAENEILLMTVLSSEPVLGIWKLKSIVMIIDAMNGRG